MEGEQEAIAEVEGPIEQEANEQPVDLEAQRTEENTEAEPTAEAEQPEPEDDFEEFEWQGKQVRGPKGLKDGTLMHADYTRKTQEIAASRKELEKQAEALRQQAEATEEEYELRGKLYNFKTQLEQYSKVDWDQWEREDPMEAMAGWRRYQQLQNEARTAYGDLTGRINKRTEAAQQETAKRLSETRQFAEKNIPGWSPEVDAKITDFAVNVGGFDVDTLKAAYNPQIYQMLHLAWLGHQTMQKANAPKPAPKPVPLQVVAAKANPPARKSIADMNMEEYAAYRAKQNAR